MRGFGEVWGSAHESMTFLAGIGLVVRTLGPQICYKRNLILLTFII